MELREEIIPKNKLPAIRDFMENQGLKFEEDTDITLAFFDNQEIIGTASSRGKIIKGVALSPEQRGKGLGKRLVNKMIQYQRQRGIMHSLIFTSPAAAHSFKEMGFTEVSRAEPWVVMLESGFLSFQDYIEEMRRKMGQRKKKAKEKHRIKDQQISAAVIRGKLEERHTKFLRSWLQSESLLVFIGKKENAGVEENGQLPDNADPEALWLPGEDYIIPWPGFPTYFIQEVREGYPAWASLDANLFLKISSLLGINKRILWKEERQYNDLVFPLLENAGMEIIEG